MRGRIAGWRVLVTRPAHQAVDLMAALAARGAEPLACPLLAIEPVPVAVPDLAGFDWVVITSANGVDALHRALETMDRWPDSTRLAVVGPGTAQRAQDLGWPVILQASPATGENLAAQMRSLDLATRRVLRVRGDLAPPVIENALGDAGADVTILTAYRTVSRPLPAEVMERLATRTLDAVVFASGSAISSLVAAAPALDLPAWLPAACIGPVTAEVAREVGWQHLTVAESTGAEALAAAVAALAPPAG